MSWNVHFVKMQFYSVFVSRNVRNIQMLWLGLHGLIVTNTKMKLNFLKGQSLKNLETQNLS